MKGNNIMKKSKITSILAAAAIAFTSLSSPISNNTGFNIDSSAAAPTPVTDEGGIYIKNVDTTKVKIPTNLIEGIDYNRLSDVDLNALKEKDLIMLEILVPVLNSDLFGFTLEVEYDKDYFKPIVWYKDKTSVSTATEEYKKYMAAWPSISGPEVGGYDGQTSYAKNGNTLSMTVSALQINPDEYNSASAAEKAAMVKKASISEYKDKEGDYDGYEYSHSIYAVFMINKATTAKKAQISLTQHDFWYHPYLDDVTDFSYQPYDTSLDVNLWETAKVDEDTVSVLCYVKGKVIGVDKATIFLSSSNGWSVDTTYTPYDASDKDGASKGRGTAEKPYQCEYEIKGIEDKDLASEFKLDISEWCEFETPNTFNLTGSTLERLAADVKVWLYGDVDHNGEVGASDATLILRYVVGKSSITGKNFTMANVITGDDLDARDATQILRKSVGLSSVFDSHRKTTP